MIHTLLYLHVPVMQGDADMLARQSGARVGVGGGGGVTKDA